VSTACGLETMADDYRRPARSQRNFAAGGAGHKRRGQRSAAHIALHFAPVPEPHGARCGRGKPGLTPGVLAGASGNRTRHEESAKIGARRLMGPSAVRSTASDENNGYGAGLRFATRHQANCARVGHDVPSPSQRSRQLCRARMAACWQSADWRRHGPGFVAVPLD